MRIYIYVIIIAALLAWSFRTEAQDCRIPISVIVENQDATLPDGVIATVKNCLERVVTANGVSTDIDFGQFVLVLRIDILDKSIHPGPPVQVVNNIGVTIYIADAYSKTKFCSVYLELDGVGNSETKSMLAAIRQLNATNGKLSSFIETGKNKIINYYDNNYKQILAEAQRKVGLQQYEDAIMLATSIPVCSRGGNEATSFGLKIYTKHRDRYNLKILNTARLIWTANPSAEGAREAGIYLAAIDPESSCYDDAQKLAAEIKKQVRSDIDFEVRKKYHDRVSIEKQTIEAMRAIGVAFGKGQKPKTTNLTWLR